MDIIQRNFLRLLRAGAFGEYEQTEPMSEWKWKRLYQTSQIHGVTPWIADGIRLGDGDFFLQQLSPALREKFYADNTEAETDAGTFSGGTLSLTVDGLHQDAESLIMGLPAADQSGWISYGDSQTVPFVGVGYIAKYMSGGEITYVPTVIPKVVFNQISNSHATSEDSLNFQTQALTAQIKRADDADRSWKYLGEPQTTEALAEAAIKTKLGITG